MGVGGHWLFLFLFVCLLLHSIGFILFITKVRAEPLARTPESKLYFVLKWLVMRCKLRPELAADSMIEKVG